MHLSIIEVCKARYILPCQVHLASRAAPPSSLVTSIEFSLMWTDDNVLVCSGFRGTSPHNYNCQGAKQSFCDAKKLKRFYGYLMLVILYAQAFLASETFIQVALQTAYILKAQLVDIFQHGKMMKYVLLFIYLHGKMHRLVILCFLWSDICNAYDEMKFGLNAKAWMWVSLSHSYGTIVKALMVDQLKTLTWFFLTNRLRLQSSFEQVV